MSIGFGMLHEKLLVGWYIYEMGANAFLEKLVFGGISRELIQIDLVALERLAWYYVIA